MLHFEYSKVEHSKCRTRAKVHMRVPALSGGAKGGANVYCDRIVSSCKAGLHDALSDYGVRGTFFKAAARRSGLAGGARRGAAAGAGRSAGCTALDRAWGGKLPASVAVDTARPATDRPLLRYRRR